MCKNHVPSQTNPANHYKAVCRALVAESIELTTFLETVSSNRTVSRNVRVCVVALLLRCNLFTQFLTDVQCVFVLLFWVGYQTSAAFI